MDLLRAWLLPQAWWRRGGLTFVLGLLSGLAFAPIYLIPLWPLAFGVTLALLYTTPGWRGRLWLAFLFNHGAMLSGFYWIALAPATFPGLEFMVVLALILLPAVLGVFGTLALFIGSFWRRDPLSFAGLMAALWLFFEWRRGIDLTGPGWNRVGMIWTADPTLMQLGAFGGVFVLSALAVLTGLGVFWALMGRGPLGLSVLVGVPVLLLSFGLARLGLAPLDSQETLAGVNIRLVQANIPKGGGGSAQDILDEHIYWSTTRPTDALSHIIWPEGSVRYNLDRRPDVRAALYAALGPNVRPLVYGRRDADGGVGTHVSAYLLDPKTDTWDAYDKINLVPFGEYIPWRGVLSSLGFQTLTGGFLDRQPGHGPRTLRVGSGRRESVGQGAGAVDLGVGVFVCYDSIYTGLIVDRADRPAWLATITEDAWYIEPSIPWLAKTPGPYQHAAEARLRAVEEGLSVARASNPGLSLVYDPYGRIWTGTVGLNKRGSIDSTIPVPLPPTPYSRLGPTWSVWLCILFYLFLCAPRLMNSRR